MALEQKAQKYLLDRGDNGTPADGLKRFVCRGVLCLPEQQFTPYAGTGKMRRSDANRSLDRALLEAPAPGKIS